MPISSKVCPEGKHVWISVSERFDFPVYKEFRDAYQLGSPSSEYILDLNGIEYMDSSALGMLLVLRDYAGGEQAKIKITGYSAAIAKLFKLSGFDRLFTLAR